MKQTLVCIVHIFSYISFLILAGLILIAVTLFPKRFF